MKKIILAFVTLFAAHTQVHAQEPVKDSLGSNKKEEFKIAALPYYNFGKGLGMTSADSLFQFNIRFRMQNRVTYFDYEDGDSNYEAQVRRLRLRFDGYVGNPKFQYAIQLSFAPGDVSADENGANIKIIRDASVFYAPNSNWLFLLGQTKLPGNRQRVNSSGALQLTDRSINNARFTIDRDFGFQAYYLKDFKDKFSWRIKTALTTGQGRNFSAKDNGVALTGKVELLPFGTFTKGGEYFEGDVKREKNFKMMLSGGYHQNNHATLTEGTLGRALYDPRTLKSTMVDAIFKYRGWAGMVAYMNRNTKDPITTRVDANGNQSMRYVYVGNGMDYQLSYNFPSKYELIGRFSTQKVRNELYNINVPHQKQYSIGLTKYIWEHAFKIQTEVTMDELRYINGDKKNNFYIRFQIEMGI